MTPGKPFAMRFAQHLRRARSPSCSGTVASGAKRGSALRSGQMRR